MSASRSDIDRLLRVGSAVCVASSGVRSCVSQVSRLSVQRAGQRGDGVFENNVGGRVGRENAIEREADPAGLAEQRRGHNHQRARTRPLDFPSHREHWISGHANPVARLSPATLAHTRFHQLCHLRVGNSGRPATHDLNCHRAGLRQYDRSRDRAGAIDIRAGTDEKSDWQPCGTRQNPDSPPVCTGTSIAVAMLPGSQ
jgi:hypothetical protein